MPPTPRALPSLRQLRHLVALAEHGHFGRAAQASHVTQSSVSASLKELEALLGATLVERTKRRVVITPLGREVVRRAREVLAAAAAIVDCAAAAAPLGGDLRLGTIPTIAPFLLPRVLPRLRRAYPRLKLYLKEERTATLIAALEAGELDLLLLAFPYPTRRLKTRLFADDPFWVALPEGHPLAARERIATALLAGESLLLLEEGHCLREQALSACRLGGGDAVQGSSLNTLAQMVDNGLGLTLLPKMAIDAGIAQGTRIVLRPLEGPRAAREIGFAWRASSARAAEFELLAAFFRDELATPLPPKRRARTRARLTPGRGAP